MQAFDRLEGVAAPLPLANIDTDKIVPSRFLKTVSKSGLSEALFADLRKAPDFVLNHSPWTGARILVALDNFGCGSSREHAPWALAAFGVRCVIAPSFAEIFEANCRNNGILTVTLPREQVEGLMALVGDPDQAMLAVDLPDQTVTATDTVHRFEIEPAHKNALLQGLNEIDRTLEMADAIDAYETSRRASTPWMWEPINI